MGDSQSSRASFVAFCFTNQFHTARKNHCDNCKCDFMK